MRIVFLAIAIVLTSCSFINTNHIEVTDDGKIKVTMKDGYILEPYMMSMSLFGVKNEKDIEMVLDLQVNDEIALQKDNFSIFIDKKEIRPVPLKDVRYFEAYGKNFASFSFKVNKELLEKMVKGKEVLLLLKFEGDKAAYGDFTRYKKDKRWETRLSAKEGVQDFLLNF